MSGDHASTQFFSFVGCARIRDSAGDAGVGPHQWRFHMKGSSRLGALALMITLSAHAAQAKDLFVVEGYETMTSPRLLSEGRYEELIEQSSPHGWRDPTEASFAATNLCIAHIKTAQLEAARASCDAAIVAARSHRRASSMGTHERWLAMARAYSNRAVLNWASGDRAAAQADLVKAARYAPEAHFVSRNTRALTTRGEAASALAAVAAER